jgi:putative ABC transport system permease protein
METWRLSARLARSRPGETLIAIIGVALGVGALVGVSTLIRGYDEYQGRLARNPLSREISVSGFRGQRDSSQAVVASNANESEPLRLSMADGAKAAAEVEGLGEAFQYQGRRFSTVPLSRSNSQDFAMAAGPGGPGVPGGPGGPGGADGGAPMPPPPEAIIETVTTPEAILAVDEVAVEQVQGMVISPSFFKAWDLEPALGSLFDSRDAGNGKNLAVVGISLAKTLYGGDGVLGKRLRLNGTVYTIIGVLKPDPWEDGTRQLSFDDMVFTQSRSRSFTTADGRTIAVAFGADELSFMAAGDKGPARVGSSLQAWFDREYGQGRVRVTTEAGRYQRELTQRQGVLFVLTLLSGAAAAASSVNLFNIMAGRALKRTRSYGIMRAVGASSGTVFASVMAETTIAAGLGALASLFLSPFLFGILEGALTAAAGTRIPVRLDPFWLVAATLVSSAVAVLLVAAPARSASTAHIAEALKGE